MNTLHRSLAAASMAAIITGTIPNALYAFDSSKPNTLQIEKRAGTIVLADNATKPKKIHLRNVILKGYDPVAYFKQGKAVPGDPTIKSRYKGSTYLFASQEDKAEFDKDPARFEPQYGGFCANSMSRGVKADIDPKVFRVYKDKLYVCSSPRALAEFSSNIDANISKADENWLKIGASTYNTESRGFDKPWPFGPESTQQ
jgi:YHS domain-containing protein